MTEKRRKRFTVTKTIRMLLLAVLMTAALSMLSFDVYAASQDPAVAADGQTLQTQEQAADDGQIQAQAADEGQTEAEDLQSTGSEESGVQAGAGDVQENGAGQSGNGQPDEGTSSGDVSADDPAEEDGWHEDETGWYYIENGERVCDTFREIDGAWWRFDADGYAIEASVYTAGDTPFGTGERVWFYNMSGGSYGADMILLESGGRFGLIDAGNRYDDTIEDADGTVYDAPQSRQLSSQRIGKTGREGMIYLIETLGVEHLDFIIGTHAHSDHIGGIPEIAELAVCGKDGTVRYLIDESTVYFYKTYQHINSQEDDLGETDADSWHNQAFVYQALKAVEDRGGKTVAVNVPASLQRANAAGTFNSVSYEARTSDRYDDRMILSWANVRLDLYNLFTTKNTTGENVNSIVTVATIGGRKVYLGGDMNGLERVEQRLASVIRKDHGTIDVMKASHHGNNNSNTKEMTDLLRPKVVVTTGYRTSATAVSPSESYQSFKYYANKNYGTQFYEAGASDKMFLVDLTGGNIQLHAVSGEGADAALVSADTCKETAVPQNGWSHWWQEFGSHSETLWYYFENGKAATGWTKIEGDWYYFAKDGMMQKNCWKSDSTGWCYLNGKGVMITNGWARDTHGWCWMDAGGHWVKATKWIEASDGWYYISKGYCVFDKWVKDSKGWCYVGGDGRMITNGWAKDSKGWCWLNASGHMVYNKWIKDSKGDWYYIKKSGYMAADEWTRDSHGWMYMAANGKITKSKWVKYKNDWYYLKADGYMATGTLKIGSKIYKFASSGKWVK